MDWIKNFWDNNWLRKLVQKIRDERAYRKRLKEIKKRDPFIYK